VSECNRACRIFTRIDHEDIVEAVLADLVDAIPILGDISTFIRSRYVPKDELEDITNITLAIDFVADLLPFGDIFDLLVPANTIRFLMKERGIGLGPKTKD